MLLISRDSYLGHGAYSVPFAAQLTGVRANTLRRWIDPQQGVVRRAFRPDEQVLSFLELMELLFIKMFREEGVSLQAIRKASRAAAKKFRTEYPFAVKRFDTDGRSIFATLAKNESNEEMVQDLQKSQYVFSQIVRPFFRKLDYDSEEISRYWPLRKNGRVVLDPQRQFGRPVDAQTGLPTKALFDAVKPDAGQDEAAVARWFDVPISAVRAAVQYEQSLVR